MLSLRLALVPALLAIASAGADLAQQTLSKMEEASATFKGLTADFKQVHYTAVIQEGDESTGSIIVRRAKPKEMQFLMQVKEPDPKQIAYSGHTLDQYNPKTNIDSRIDVEKKYSGVVNQYMLLGFGSSPNELGQAYAVAPGAAETVARRRATRIELTPLKPDTSTHLLKAEIWVPDDTGIAVQQKLTYEGGDYILVTYSNMRINPNISESSVKLKLPGNATVNYPLK